MSKSEKVEVASKDGVSYTVVGGGDNGPWWVKYSMQAGFMFVLILVLWGAYDLFKSKLPTLVEPAVAIAGSLEEIKDDHKRASEALVKQADAAEKQADAIDRWVNQQGFRVTAGDGRVYGPPAMTQDP